MYHFENRENASKAGSKSRRGTSKEISNLRSIIHLLVTKKQGKVEKWLEQVALDNPEKALKLYINLLDFVLLKLNRVEEPPPQVNEEEDKLNGIQRMLEEKYLKPRFPVQ